jgi:DNA polymerase-3 subunit gamma/tau
MTTDYQVLARKYRPQTFSQVLGQEPIVQTLKHALKRNTVSHAYLFCGSRGTGKTTLARILSKALNCSNISEDFEPCNSCSFCHEINSGSSLDMIEIDGASHRGIDDIKTISESVSYCPSHGKWKIYIIDEVHMLTKEAFNALLKTLEEPPAKVIFIFATTESHKIPATIVSRCQRFNLQRIGAPLISQKLRRIADDLGVTVEDSTLLRLARFAEGGLRDAESLFDQLISYSDGTLTDKTVHDVLGIMPQELFLDLDKAVFSADIAFAFRLTQTLFSQGKELSHFLEDLTEHYKTLLFVKLSCNDLLTSLDASYKEALTESAKLYTQEQCLYILDLIMQTQSSIKHAVSQQLSLEHLLTKIVRAKQRVPVDYLVQRLSELEQSRRSDTEVPPEHSEVARQPVAKSTAPAAKPQAAPTAAPVQKVAAEPAPIAPKAAVPLAPIVPSAPLPGLPIDPHSKARHDTLMQFAAVELEGTIRKDIRKG